MALTASDAESSASRHFPPRSFDVNGQQLDLRSTNSWLLKLGEIAVPEIAEVFAINTLAPFVITSALLPLLERGRSAAAAAPPLHADWRWVVNVGAMEGKFYRHKTANHPHTNMAKAALNMMTRTCAADLAAKGIFMCSVDTGWINDENPLAKAAKHAEASGFATPIDEIDAAARIVDPIFGPLLSVAAAGAAAKEGREGGAEQPLRGGSGGEGKRQRAAPRTALPPFGVFLKDFAVTEW